MSGRQRRSTKGNTKGEDINVGGKVREISKCENGNKVKRELQERGMINCVTTYKRMGAENV